MEGFGANFNSREQMLELVHSLHEVGYNFKQYHSPVLTCIWRLVSEEMFEFHDLWWKYSKIGSNRDQVSFDCARQLTGLEWTRIHDWETMGLDLASNIAKSHRQKRHPQAGHFTEKSTYNQILKECKDLLDEIRPMTGIEDEHQIWQVAHNEVRYPKTNEWLPEGTWWYDPTLVKSGTGTYTVQNKVKLVIDEHGSVRNLDSHKNNAFWVRRLKRSIGITDLPPEMYYCHIWDWGSSFRDYVIKNVLRPALPQ
tara:strand:- start:135 stop:893 length:759 start_codon:yes stop_codon:yes gene_type:complete